MGKAIEYGITKPQSDFDKSQVAGPVKYVKGAKSGGKEGNAKKQTKGRGKT